MTAAQQIEALAKSLEQALRFIEVSQAYKGAVRA